MEYYEVYSSVNETDLLTSLEIYGVEKSTLVESDLTAESSALLKNVCKN
jgi:hypothetical protein